MAVGRRTAAAVAGHGALLLANLTFSAWNVLAEGFPQHGNVLLLCAIRDGTALAALSAVWAARVCVEGRRRRLEAPSSAAGGACSAGVAGRDLALLVAVGLTGPFLSPVATVLCATWSGADVAGNLNAVEPALTSLLAVIFGLERPTWALAAAVSLGTVGGLLAGLGTSTEVQHTQPGQRLVAGVLAGFVMALAQAIFLIAMKPLLRANCARDALPASLVVTSGYAIAFGASLLSFLSILAVQGVKETVGDWDREATLLGLYAGLVCGAMNYSLITWANKLLPVTVCALYCAMQPPCTALIAFFAKDESLTPF